MSLCTAQSRCVDVRVCWCDDRLTSASHDGEWLCGAELASLYTVQWTSTVPLSGGVLGDWGNVMRPSRVTFCQETIVGKIFSLRNSVSFRIQIIMVKLTGILWYYFMRGKNKKNEKMLVLLLNHISINCYISNKHIAKKYSFKSYWDFIYENHTKIVMVASGRLDTRIRVLRGRFALRDSFWYHNDRQNDGNTCRRHVMFFRDTRVQTKIGRISFFFKVSGIPSLSGFHRVDYTSQLSLCAPYWGVSK